MGFYRKPAAFPAHTSSPMECKQARMAPYAELKTPHDDTIRRVPVFGMHFKITVAPGVS